MALFDLLNSAANRYRQEAFTRIEVLLRAPVPNLGEAIWDDIAMTAGSFQNKQTFVQLD